MPMALKKDVYQAKSQCGDQKPIDLTHLSAQTMGDQSLEKEVLAIFVNQVKVLQSLMKTAKDKTTLQKSAHALKGACKGIGAIRLADLAQEIEEGADMNPAFVEEMQTVVDYAKELLVTK